MNIEKILDIRFSLPEEVDGIALVASSAVFLRLLEALILFFVVLLFWSRGMKKMNVRNPRLKPLLLTFVPKDRNVLLKLRHSWDGMN